MTGYKDRLLNAFWRFGVRFTDLARSLGLMDRRMMQTLERVAVRVVPSPNCEFTAPLDLGLTLTLPPQFTRARTYAAGVYEDRVTRLFKQIVREGMTVVDLGAFCGYYTLLASRLVGTTGHVYALEADPRNFSYLQKNVRDNNCTNVTATQTAILNRTSVARLVRHRNADHHWISVNQPADHDSVVVTTTTLDELISRQGWPHVHLVKIDIEGSEQAALEGMRELSLRNPDLLLIMEFDEANLRRATSSRDSIARTLGDLGFVRGYIIETNMKLFNINAGIPRIRITCNFLLSKS